MHARFLKRYADSSLKVTDEVADLAALGDDGFAIDHIRKHTWDGDVLKMHVSWEGFEDGDPSWEPAAKLLEDAPVVVNKYVKTIEPDKERAKVVAALEASRAKKPKQPGKTRGRSRK